MKEKKDSYHHGNLRSILVKTATQMIANKGIGRVTMRALSERIGVSQTAPYRHFESKSDLLSAVAADGFRRLEKRFKRINENRSRDALAAVRQIGLDYIEFAVNDPAVFRLMFGHEIIQQDRTPDLRDAAQCAFNELLRAIEAGKVTGGVKSGSTLSLANTAWASIHGLAILLIDGQLQGNPGLQGVPTLLTGERMENQKTIQEVSAFGIDFVLDGLRGGADHI